MLSISIRVLCLILTHSFAGTIKVECSRLGNLYQSLAPNGDFCICTGNVKTSAPNADYIQPQAIDIFESTGETPVLPPTRPEPSPSSVIRKIDRGEDFTPFTSGGNIGEPAIQKVEKPVIVEEKTDGTSGIPEPREIGVEEVKNKEVSVEPDLVKPTFDVKQDFVQETIGAVVDKPAKFTQIKEVTRENNCNLGITGGVAVSPAATNSNDFKTIEDSRDIKLSSGSTSDLGGHYHYQIKETKPLIISTSTSNSGKVSIYKTKESNSGSSLGYDGTTNEYSIGGGKVSVSRTDSPPSSISSLYGSGSTGIIGSTVSGSSGKHVMGHDAGSSLDLDYGDTTNQYSIGSGKVSISTIDSPPSLISSSTGSGTIGGSSGIIDTAPYSQTVIVNKHIAGSNEGSSLDLDYDGNTNGYTVGKGKVSISSTGSGSARIDGGAIGGSTGYIDTAPHSRTVILNKHIMGSNKGSSFDLDYDGNTQTHLPLSTESSRIRIVRGKIDGTTGITGAASQGRTVIYNTGLEDSNPESSVGLDYDDTSNEFSIGRGKVSISRYDSPQSLLLSSSGRGNAAHGRTVIYNKQIKGYNAGSSLDLGYDDITRMDRGSPGRIVTYNTATGGSGNMAELSSGTEYDGSPNDYTLDRGGSRKAYGRRAGYGRRIGYGHPRGHSGFGYYQNRKRAYYN